MGRRKKLPKLEDQDDFLSFVETVLDHVGLLDVLMPSLKKSFTSKPSDFPAKGEILIGIENNQMLEDRRDSIAFNWGLVKFNETGKDGGIIYSKNIDKFLNSTTTYGFFIIENSGSDILIILTDFKEVTHLYLNFDSAPDWFTPLKVAELVSKGMSVKEAISSLIRFINTV